MKKLVRTWVLVLAGLLGSWPAAAYAQAADDLVREITTQVMDHIQSQRDILAAEPARIYSLVNEEILPYFDFQKMSQWVLGKHWRQATPAQRTQFSSEFRTLLVKTYAKALLEYSSGGVTVLPAREESKRNRVTVRTEVSQAGGFPIPINYSMYQVKDSWRVYDVTIDGISLVTNYRNAFSNRIRQGGLEKLIALMAQRNASVPE